MNFKFPKLPRLPKIKIGKKNTLNNYPYNYSNSYTSKNYSNYNRLNSDDWESYYRYSGQKGYNRKKPRGRLTNFYRAVVAFALLLVVISVRESDNPMAVEARDGLRYALTTEWNFQPALDKAVALGLRAVNMDMPFFNDVPGTTPVLAPKITGEYALPVSGQVTKRYGWITDDDGLEQFNSGVFISCEAGTYVRASRKGKVARMGADKALGNYVLLDHGSQDYTLYAGMEEILVKENQQVNVETVIGVVAEGESATETGIHFEIRENNKLVDPLSKLQVTND
ncbi:M23 family metallopeptidase [Peptococcaceae bacterium 1198_IL3148]